MSASTSSWERQSRLRAGTSRPALPGPVASCPHSPGPPAPRAAGTGRANGPEWARQGQRGTSARPRVPSVLIWVQNPAAAGRSHVQGRRLPSR